MAGDSSPRRDIQFPQYQDGGTVLRGRAFKKAHVRKPSPSEYLVEVLKKADQIHAVPPSFNNKADLSYSSSSAKRCADDPILVLHPTPRPSMQYFVAQYIEMVCGPAQAKSAGVHVPESVRAWIVSKGYAWEDLELWTNILVARSSDDAVSMLGEGYAKGPTPIWVVLFLLRRERLTLGAFRHLLRFTLRRVGLFDSPDGRHQSQDWAIDEKTIFLLFLRLLRHARSLLPAAIVPLTKLITTKINPRNLGTRHSDEEIPEEKMVDKRAKLAHIYNKALRLLSLPATPNPYASAAYQEKAQLDILRRVAEYEPPIPITEDGYRALVRIQLGHVKTDRERLWASLKSKGWPPWKEDRTAMDEDILHGEAISRAGQLLRKMQEAGYPTTEPDKAATILTGWDLDESPTIQTRIIHYPTAQPVANGNKDIQGSQRPPREVLDPAIWAARVRSTRTLEEAWACFLAYDSLSAPQDQQVYLVMFEKIVADRRRKRRLKVVRDLDVTYYGPGWKESLPGDSPDVWPVPKSHRERIDPTLKLPSTKYLLDRMIAKGIAPTGRCLEFLVQAAPTHRDASNIMMQVLESNSAVRSLLRRDITPEQAFAIPDKIFRAYILLLTRLWHRPIPFGLKYPQQAQPLLIHRALDLLSLKRSKDRHCWNSVLISLSQYGLQKLSDTSTGIMRDAIETMKKLEVELDQEGFGIVCKAFSMRTIEREHRLKARYSGLGKLTNTDEILKSAKEIQDDWDDHLEHCSADSRYLRTLFNHLVGAEPNKSAEALSGLQVPIPHIMYRYIRALGIMYDFEALLSVADFLKQNASMVTFNTQYSINGRVRLRAALVSLRAHLEYRAYLQYGRNKSHGAVENNNGKWCSTGQYFDSNVDVNVAETVLAMPRHSEEQVVLARLKLDDPEARELGGWPSDEEVENYLRGQSTGQRKQSSASSKDDGELKPTYPNLT